MPVAIDTSVLIEAEQAGSVAGLLPREEGAISMFPLSLRLSF